MQYSFQNGFFSQMNNYNNSCTPTEKHISSTSLSPPINFLTVFGGTLSQINIPLFFLLN